jgi:hypothetical protein
VLFILGLVIAIIFNVDTIAIHRVLSKNDKAREQIVQMAISKQQQYGEIIKNMDEQKNNLTGIQLEVKKTADSVYRETYQLLSNDANSANTILGLGRPWKDSVNFYKDSLTDAFRVQKKALSEKLRLAHSIENSRDSVIKIIKALSISPRQTTFLQDSLSLSRIKDSLSSIIDSMNPGNIQSELDRKNFFESRCTIIHDKTEGKYFVYAPNQNGGWETLIGWLLTAWALCLGAPFWFDLLNKLISLRGTGTKINSGDKNNTSTAVNAAAPAQININTNSAEEAVG